MIPAGRGKRPMNDENKKLNAEFDEKASAGDRLRRALPSPTDPEGRGFKFRLQTHT